MSERVQVIGVLGAGTMGTGIAHVAAQNGFSVILCDVSEEILKRSIGRMEQLNQRSVEKGRITAEQAAKVMGRIRTTTDREAFAGADFVVEAIVEQLEAKKEAFRALDRITGPEVILTSNTSSMSITEMAACTSRPDRVAGMHFFNPAQVMALVEVVRGLQTSDETVAAVTGLAKRLGKTPVEVKKDSPGFIVNRILMPMFIEAMKLLEEGVASRDDIDTAVKLGLNHPMGPFTLADFTGLDVDLHVMEYFHREFGQPQYAPPMILKQLVRAGRLGRKTGAGFYTYNA